MSCSSLLRSFRLVARIEYFTDYITNILSDSQKIKIIKPSNKNV